MLRSKLANFAVLSRRTGNEGGETALLMTASTANSSIIFNRLLNGYSPLLKNRWIEILLDGRSCFAQWQDVGPCNEDDFAFVFGNATKPRNTFDAKAGLDVSPAVWHYLGMNDNGLTAWRFVDARDVPAGPWTEIVTTSGNNR
jgi:hypothetical protein